MLHAFGGPPAVAVVLAYCVGQLGNTLPIPGAYGLCFGIEQRVAAGCCGGAAHKPMIARRGNEHGSGLGAQR
jgi:hypothetical protein